MGRCLQVASDEPDLVSAPRNAGVLVHGHHVVVSVDFIRDAENLPQQADLSVHRLLIGCPEERPDSQSECRIP